MSKGSKPRPVDPKDYRNNFDKIFGKWVSPLERKIQRINDLEKDLTDCNNVLESMADDDPDRSRIEHIVSVIQAELQDLQ